VIDADIDIEGETTVPAHKLADLVHGYTGQVSLSLTDTRLAVKSGRSRANLAILPAEDFPSSEDFEPDLTFSVAAPVFHAKLHRVSHAMAKNDVRYYLNGALLHITKDGAIHLVATDGHRLCAEKFEVAPFENGWPEFDEQVNPVPLQAILPNKTVTWLLPRLAGADNVTVSVGTGMAVFNLGGVVLKTKLIDGRFPDFQAVIPRQQENYAEVSPSKFIAALSRAIVLLSDRQKSVALNFGDNGELSISATNDEQEQAVEEISYESNGGFETVEIGFNPAYLMDAMRSVGSVEKAQFHLTGQNDSALLRIEGEEARYVIMPLRL
jgi:DNA polymerase-3 subunit beta